MKQRSEPRFGSRGGEIEHLDGTGNDVGEVGQPDQVRENDDGPKFGRPGRGKNPDEQRDQPASVDASEQNRAEGRLHRGASNLVKSLSNFRIEGIRVGEYHRDDRAADQIADRNDGPDAYDM